MAKAKPIASGQTLATYGFNVPCRQFTVTANVTRDRRLPVVDEFVLRLLKVADVLPASRLASFFGFSPSEMMTVLSDLQMRGLIDISGDDIQLSPSAHDMFLSAREGVPQIVEIETMVHRLWFDLISRNMMAPDRTRPLDNLIELAPPALSKDLETSFARAAFEQNFREFLVKVRRINNPGSMALYSVSDVVPERFGSVVVLGATELVFDPEPRLVTKLLDIAPEDRPRFRQLTEAMQNGLRRLVEAEPSAASLAEFRRLSGDQSVAKHMDVAGRFDPVGWLSAAPEHSSPGRQPIWGASYLERNTARFVEMIERLELRTSQLGRPRRLSLRWYRPAGTAWGASPDLQQSLARLVSAVRSSLGSDWGVATTVVSPASARPETIKRFSNVFEAGIVSPAGHLTANTEVLVIERIGALIMSRVALSDSMSMPVGWILTDSGDVRKIEEFLASRSTEHADRLWDRGRPEPTN